MQRVNLALEGFVWSIPDPPTRPVTFRGMVKSALVTVLVNMLLLGSIVPLLFPLTFIQGAFIGFLLSATGNALFRFDYEK